MESFASSRLYQKSCASSRFLANKEENIDFENFIYCPVSFGVFRKLQTPAAPQSGQALLGAAESFFDNSLDNLDIKNINSFIESAKINPGSPIWFESNKIGHERYVYITDGPRRACSDADPLDLPKVVGATKERMIPKNSSLVFLIEQLINPLRNPSVMLYNRRQL